MAFANAMALGIYRFEQKTTTWVARHALPLYVYIYALKSPMRQALQPSKTKDGTTVPNILLSIYERLPIPRYANYLNAQCVVAIARLVPISETQRTQHNNTDSPLLLLSSPKAQILFLDEIYPLPNPFFLLPAPNKNGIGLSRPQRWLTPTPSDSQKLWLHCLNEFTGPAHLYALVVFNTKIRAGMQPLTLYPILVYRANQDWLLKLRPNPSVDGADHSNMYANDKVSKAKFKFTPATSENNLKWCVQLKFHDLIEAIWVNEETEFAFENNAAFPNLPAHLSTKDPDFIAKLETECMQTFSCFCQHMNTLAKDTTSANAKRTLEAALASLSSTFTVQVVQTHQDFSNKLTHVKAGHADPQNGDNTEVLDLTENKTNKRGREAKRSLMLPKSQEQKAAATKVT